MAPRLPRSRQDRTRALLALLLLAAALPLWAPGPAGAHAVLEESRPEADSTVADPPDEVQLWFNEPLIEDASRATVTTPEGEEVGHGEVDAEERSIHVSLQTSARGVYEVDWVTVSPVDGHTWDGSFEFRVADAAESPDGDAPATDVGTGSGTQPDGRPTPEPSADDVRSADRPSTGSRPWGGLRLLGGLGRATEYLGWLGSLGWLSLGALARSAELDWVPRRLLPWVATGTAGAAVTVLAESLQAGGGDVAAGTTALLSSATGWARLARLAVAVLALGVVVGATRGRQPAVPDRRSRVTVTLSTLLALTLLAASGHAASTGLSLLVGAGHLITAGVWAGTIVAMAVHRPPGGWRSGTGGRLVTEFAPIGLTMFAATVLLGMVRGVQELPGVSELWTSTYGRVLLAKAGLVALMVPLSWLAWRRSRPWPRLEGLLVTGAVLLAAGLAVLGPPAPGTSPSTPGEAAPDGTGRRGDAEPLAQGLPRPGDLTLAGDAGTTVVGLTVRPAQPGDNEVFAFLVPTGGIDEAGALEARLTVADREPQAMERCGEACRRATASLEGGERVEVEVREDDDQHTAVLSLPQLPAPDGTALLDRAAERMDQVRTLRYDEVFGPSDPPTTSTWEIVAPDRLHGVIRRDGEHRETLRIEDRRWRREGPDAPWEGGAPGGPSVVSNRFIWEEEPRTAARIVGTEQIDGVRTRQVSFFVPLSERLPIWYRVWVDDAHRIRRAEMRTQGHFMDHRYYDFDEDIEIEPPG